MGKFGCLMKVECKIVVEQLVHFEVHNNKQADKIAFSAIYGLHTIVGQETTLVHA